MIGQKEFKRIACQSLSNFPFGMDDHIFFEWLSAGGDGFYPTLDLYEAETAGGSSFLLFLDGTEVGNVDAILQGSEEDVLSLGSFNFLTIDGQKYVLHWGSTSNLQPQTSNIYFGFGTRSGGDRLTTPFACGGQAT